MILYNYTHKACYACQAFSKKFDEWARKHEDKASFVKVDTGTEEGREIAEANKVGFLPTVILTDDDGKQKARWEGTPTEKELLKALKVPVALYFRPSRGMNDARLRSVERGGGTGWLGLRQASGGIRGGNHSGSDRMHR